MNSGSVTINGITDRELLTLMEVKVHHEPHLGFNPQQMQPQQAQVEGKPVPIYNNVILTWNGRPGLDAVKDLLHKLTPEEKKD